MLLPKKFHIFGNFSLVYSWKDQGLHERPERHKKAHKEHESLPCNLFILFKIGFTKDCFKTHFQISSLKNSIHQIGQDKGNQ